MKNAWQKSGVKSRNGSCIYNTDDSILPINPAYGLLHRTSTCRRVGVTYFFL